jgi:hypothetical protein
MKTARHVHRHCERKRCNPVPAMDEGVPCANAVLDCFASLAMTMDMPRRFHPARVARQRRGQRR